MAKQNRTAIRASSSQATVRRPDPNGKNIEYEERRDRLQMVLEKRRAAKSTDDPKDNSKKNPATENSKK